MFYIIFNGTNFQTEYLSNFYPTTSLLKLNNDFETEWTKTSADSKKNGKYDIDGSFEASRRANLCVEAQGVAAVGRCPTHLTWPELAKAWVFLCCNNNRTIKTPPCIKQRPWGYLYTSLLHFNWPSDHRQQPLKLVSSNWWSKKLCRNTGGLLRWESCPKIYFISKYSCSLCTPL